MVKAKKLSRDIKLSWSISVILAAIPAILFATQIVAIHPAIIVAVWFTVFGASLIANGIEARRNSYISVGIIWLMSSFLTTLIIELYWVVGIVSFGTPLLVFALSKK